MPTTSYIPLALKFARADGWDVVEKVERWNAFAKRRQDLFGGIDILCCGRGRGFLGIQVCGWSGVSSHLQKLIEEPRIAAFLGAPARLEVWAFRKIDGEVERRVETLSIGGEP